MPSENFMPVDPVCGIELDESLAVEHDYDGKKIFFCCNGCRTNFSKKTKKVEKKYLDWVRLHTYGRILNFLC